jgi:streptomycin 3"-adenylyltransferase
MGNPVYFVLNACRILAYLSEGHIYSKDEGGVYGLETFPVEYHPIIRQALELYRKLNAMASFDEEAMNAFTSFLDRSISSYQHKESK